MQLESTATTKDGRNVLLYADGTWAYEPVNRSNDAALGFRGVEWGASRQEVRDHEKAPMVQELENVLIYSTQVAGLSCHVAYIFSSEMLVRSKYRVIEKYVNHNKFIEEFDSLKIELGKKYGSPTSDQEFWSDDLFRDDYQDWGTAVSSGHMSRFVRWETPHTIIILALGGEQYECELGIEYSSVNLGFLEDESRDAQLQQDL